MGVRVFRVYTLCLHCVDYVASVVLRTFPSSALRRLCGVTPFARAASSPPLSVQICMALRPDFALVFPDHVSPLARDLLSRLLCRPSRRLTADVALAHPWFASDKAPKVG